MSAVLPADVRDALAEALHRTNPAHAGCPQSLRDHGGTYYGQWADALAPVVVAYGDQRAAEVVRAVENAVSKLLAARPDVLSLHDPRRHLVLLERNTTNRAILRIRAALNIVRIRTVIAHGTDGAAS